MTREEAIIDLNALKFILDNDQYTDEIEEALDTAISALQQPEIVRCKDCKYVGTDATCCLVCKREGMGLRPFHVYPDDYCSYAERREDAEAKI